MPTRPELSIVIVTHNSPEWTARCLDALAGDGAPAVPFEVVVVDSGSRPEAREALRARSRQARVVLVDGNIGFGRGCNAGVRHSRGRQLLLLNPDAIALPGSIDAMLGFAATHPEHGIVGGRTLRPDGSTDPSSCWGRPTLWSLACFATGLTAVAKRSRVFDPESLGRWERDTVREVDIVTGCLLLTTRELYERLGGFDPRYFMYGEDADLSLRARAAGWRPAITPAAAVVHAVGASSASLAGKHRLVLTGKATLARSHRGRPGAAVAVALLTAGVGLRALPERLGGTPDPSWLPVWRERAAWRRGFPAPSGEEPVVEVLDDRDPPVAGPVDGPVDARPGRVVR
ncbi:MAG: glycosyltransferase family 2 protein [Actinobacteria bacterium]|nr:glycosyltransferase family 2 protein [Actinomycetota bacterium]MBI3686599.1 glycosyltransferase family 2 protein [Actinomycetota bacterium]